MKKNVKFVSIHNVLFPSSGDGCENNVGHFPIALLMLRKFKPLLWDSPLNLTNRLRK